MLGVVAYKNPTLCTALSSCSASFCLPPGTSNCERSRVTRSAQSTNHLSVRAPLLRYAAYERSDLDSSGWWYTGNLCETELGAVCTSVAIVVDVLVLFLPDYGRSSRVDLKVIRD